MCVCMYKPQKCPWSPKARNCQKLDKITITERQFWEAPSSHLLLSSDFECKKYGMNRNIRLRAQFQVQKQIFDGQNKNSNPLKQLAEPNMRRKYFPRSGFGSMLGPGRDPKTDKKRARERKRASRDIAGSDFCRFFSPIPFGVALRIKFWRA